MIEICSPVRQDKTILGIRYQRFYILISSRGRLRATMVSHTSPWPGLHSAVKSSTDFASPAAVLKILLIIGPRTSSWLTLIKKASNGKCFSCCPVNRCSTCEFLYPGFDVSFLQMWVDVKRIWRLNRFGSDEHHVFKRKA